MRLGFEAQGEGERQDSKERWEEDVRLKKGSK